MGDDCWLLLLPATQTTRRMGMLLKNIKIIAGRNFSCCCCCCFCAPANVKKCNPIRQQRQASNSARDCGRKGITGSQPAIPTAAANSQQSATTTSGSIASQTKTVQTVNVWQLQRWSAADNGEELAWSLLVGAVGGADHVTCACCKMLNAVPISFSLRWLLQLHHYFVVPSLRRCCTNSLCSKSTAAKAHQSLQLLLHTVLQCFAVVIRRCTQHCKLKLIIMAIAAILSCGLSVCVWMGLHAASFLLHNCSRCLFYLCVC